jgi:hypothetical protein
MNINEALKVDQLCHRILGDIGSIHARMNVDEDGTVHPMPLELVQMRRYIREISDKVREQHPNAFFK